MLTLIGQMLGCLIVAAAIGMAMGWFLRSFTTSEKRQQLSEIAARLRGREHEMDSLHHELKVRTSAVQILESKMVAAEAALKDLQAEAAAKAEQVEALQNELSDKTAASNALSREADTLRQALVDTEQTLETRTKGLAELQGELETVQDLMVRRDHEIATLKTWVDQLEIKDAEIIRLRGRVSELESLQDRLTATEGRLLDTEQRAHKAQAEWDALEGRLRAQIEESRAERASQEGRAQARAAEHLALLREQDEVIRQLREESKELEALRRDVAAKDAQLVQAEERRVLDVSEREEEIAALRRRLVEYRVAQGLVAGKANARPSGAAAPDKPASKSGNDSGHSKDDLKKIHGIGPVIERVLNRMGTHTFLQIAQWDHTDIERVADKLNTFPDRIVRDNWIEGAKEQHYLKYGEKL
jgi:predicted flap endonuclease-1-like 5' DNA nuclease